MNKPLVLPIKTPLGYYFYETNKNEIVSVNKDLFLYIQAIQEDDISVINRTSEDVKIQYVELVECGYLSSRCVKEIRHPATNDLEQFMNRSIARVTLQVTQNCNLRCRYCIYSETNKNKSQRTHSQNSMTFEIAKRAIDFYWGHSRESDVVSIGFYGGEPLLEFPLVEKIVKYAEDIFAGKEINFHITTNATLLTDEIINFMIEHHFHMTFSIDGPKKAHDRNRIFPNGKGTYDIVMDSLSRMYKNDPLELKESQISMVIDPSQNYEGFIELVKQPFLSNIGIKFSPVEEDSAPLGFSPDFTEKYNYDRFLAMVKYYRNGEQGYRNKIEKQSMDSFNLDLGRMSSVILGTVGAPGGPCIPGKLRLLIDCFGNFYPCEKVDEDNCMRIGSLDAGFDYSKIRYLLNVGQIDSERCMKCRVFSLCNICAKVADNGEELSSERKAFACQSSKQSAYNKIQEMILDHEHYEHEKCIKRWSDGEEK